MPEKDGEKLITCWIEERQRDQFQTLCKTMGISASSVIRGWVRAALEEQSINIVVANTSATPSPAKTAEPAVMDMEVIKGILKRLKLLESQIPEFSMEELMQMKREILDGNFGSMRYRMGVMESQVQALGGSIAWDSVSTKESSPEEGTGSLKNPSEST